MRARSLIPNSLAYCESYFTNDITILESCQEETLQIFRIANCPTSANSGQMGGTWLGAPRNGGGGTGRGSGGGLGLKRPTSANGGQTWGTRPTCRRMWVTVVPSVRRPGDAGDRPLSFVRNHTWQCAENGGRSSAVRFPRASYSKLVTWLSASVTVAISAAVV